MKVSAEDRWGAASEPSPCLAGGYHGRSIRAGLVLVPVLALALVPVREC